MKKNKLQIEQRSLFNLPDNHIAPEPLAITLHRDTVQEIRSTCLIEWKTTDRWWDPLPSATYVLHFLARKAQIAVLILLHERVDQWTRSATSGILSRNETSIWIDSTYSERGLLITKEPPQTTYYILTSFMERTVNFLGWCTRTAALNLGIPDKHGMVVPVENLIDMRAFPLLPKGT